MIPRQARSTLFPYTTLFRSQEDFLMPSDFPVTRRRFFLASGALGDRKSTRLNSSHVSTSYAVFCMTKKRVRNRRQLNSLQKTWPYGYSMPITVRYTQDAFSRSGWLWPVDAKGEPLKATSYMAVGF